MKKTNGFTLIELLAVVVIIAIIATIGIYSVTKIMNQSRLNSLKDTAFAVKKTASLYANSNPDMTFPQTINLTPGSADASLMDLSKDPWGKDYESVIAKLIKINNKLSITVYLMTSYKDYYLANNSDVLKELVYEPQIVASPSYADLGSNFKIEYFLPDVYSVTTQNVSFTGGTPISIGEYTIINNTTNLNDAGNRELELNINKPGSYQLQITIGDGTKSASSQIIGIDVYSKNLPSILYLRGDEVLGTANSTSGDSIWHKTATSYTAYYSVKIIKKTSVSEEVISDWQQAQVSAPYITGDLWNGTFTAKSATYNFPGWIDGNFGDQLVIEVGMSSSNSGTPNAGIKRFVTTTLNTRALQPHTFTIYYYVANDYPWDAYERTFQYGSATAPSRIVTVPIS